MSKISKEEYATYKESRLNIATELAREVGLPIVNSMKECSDGSIELGLSGMFVGLLIRFKMDPHGSWEVVGKPLFNIPSVPLKTRMVKEMVRFFEGCPWGKSFDDKEKFPMNCQEEGCDLAAVSLIGSGWPRKCGMYCDSHGQEKLRRSTRVAYCPNCDCEFDCSSDE